jgi:hypothetical protein
MKEEEKNEWKIVALVSAVAMIGLVFMLIGYYSNNNRQQSQNLQSLSGEIDQNVAGQASTADYYAAKAAAQVAAQNQDPLLTDMITSFKLAGKTECTATDLNPNVKVNLCSFVKNPITDVCSLKDQQCALFDVSAISKNNFGEISTCTKECVNGKLRITITSNTCKKLTQDSSCPAGKTCPDGKKVCGYCLSNPTPKCEGGQLKTATTNPVTCAVTWTSTNCSTDKECLSGGTSCTTKTGSVMPCTKTPYTQCENGNRVQYIVTPECQYTKTPFPCDAGQMCNTQTNNCVDINLPTLQKTKFNASFNLKTCTPETYQKCVNGMLQQRQISFNCADTLISEKPCPIDQTCSEVDDACVKTCSEGQVVLCESGQLNTYYQHANCGLAPMPNQQKCPSGKCNTDGKTCEPCEIQTLATYCKENQLVTETKTPACTTEKLTNNCPAGQHCPEKETSCKPILSIEEDMTCPALEFEICKDGIFTKMMKNTDCKDTVLNSIPCLSGKCDPSDKTACCELNKEIKCETKGNSKNWQYGILYEITTDCEGKKQPKKLKAICGNGCDIAGDACKVCAPSTVKKCYNNKLLTINMIPDKTGSGCKKTVTNVETCFKGCTGNYPNAACEV